MNAVDAPCGVSHLRFVFVFLERPLARVVVATVRRLPNPRRRTPPHPPPVAVVFSLHTTFPPSFRLPTFTLTSTHISAAKGGGEGKKLFPAIDEGKASEGFLSL